MERTGRLPIVVVAIVCLLGGAGCTMCPDPYDSSGPVPNGSAPQNDFHARSNGIIPLGSSPLPWPAVVDAAPVQGTDVPTIAEAEPESESPVAVPDDVLEIPADESVLTDDTEIASEPQPADDEPVRMLSAAEDAPVDEPTEIAPPDAATARAEPPDHQRESRTDDLSDESDAPAEPAAPRPLVRPAPRPAPVPSTRPQPTARRQSAPASSLDERTGRLPEPRLDSDPAPVDLQPAVGAEPPSQPAAPVPPGLSETPGWRPRGYVRPPAVGR